jgi:hypothetical protein
MATLIIDTDMAASNNLTGLFGDWFKGVVKSALKIAVQTFSAAVGLDTI